MADTGLWTYVKDLLKDPNKEMPADELKTPSATDWQSRKAREAAKGVVTEDHLGTTWKHVLRAEGGYVNNPQDPGGETKFGVTKRDYPHLDIKNLTAQDAQQVFKNNYYDAVGGDVIAKINPGLATHVADMAYNAGPNAAIKLLYDVAGLNRSGKITPELIDRLDNSQDIVKNYSAARLKYYSSLANAPTFLKGWTNRVRALNKAIGMSQGMEKLYAAALDADVDYLVSKGDGYVKNRGSRFAELSLQEKGRLQRANELANPLHADKEETSLMPADMTDKKTSSLGNIFKATYDQKYYLNTASGQEELRRQQINRAFDENLSALQEQLTPDQIKKLGFREGDLRRGFFDFAGLSESVADDALANFTISMKKLKQQYPKLKLPYESANQVQELISQKAKDIERSYGKLTSPEFSDGIASSLGKLGHILGGYLPAQVLGSLADPIEAVTNLVPAGKITQGAGLLKNMAVAMLGTGASQAIVQSDKEKLGLEGSLLQGTTETVAAGAGVGVLGAVGMGLKKLWSLGSRQAGEQAAAVADDALKALSKEIPNAEIQSLKFALNQSKDLAEQYIRNPYGDSYLAKQKLEGVIKNIHDDWAKGLPARDLPIENVRSYVPYSEEVYSSWLKALDPDERPAFTQAVKLINDLRAGAIGGAKTLDELDVSVVPILENGKIKAFETEEAARAFIIGRGTGEELYTIRGSRDVPFYVGKQVDITDAATASTRFADSEVVDAGGVQVKSLATPEDLKTFSDNPQYSKLGRQEFLEATGGEPTYTQARSISANAIEARRLEIEQAMKTSQADLDKAFNAAYDRIKKLSPKTMDNELLIDPEIKTLIDDVNTTKLDLTEVQTCFFGGGKES